MTTFIAVQTDNPITATIAILELPVMGIVLLILYVYLSKAMNYINFLKLKHKEKGENYKLTTVKITTATFKEFFEKHTRDFKIYADMGILELIKKIYSTSTQEETANNTTVVSEGLFLLRESGTLYLQKTLEWFELSWKTESDRIEFKKQITFIYQQQQKILSAIASRLAASSLQKQIDNRKFLEEKFKGSVEGATPEYFRVLE